MKLIKFAIKNYLTIFVTVFIIVIFGIKSYFSMPREIFPDIKVPYIFINTFYLGVSPKDIETLVTDPLEKKLKNIKGLDKITSTSRESVSSIFLEFSPDTDIETDLQRVKDRVDLAKNDLPKDADPPAVNEFSFENFPFIYVNLYGRLDLVRLKQIADKLKDELEKVNGVLDVNVIGGQEREIRIIVSPEKLQEKLLSYMDIARAIQGENINIPGGNIDMGKAKYSIRIPGEFNNIEEIRNIIIKSAKGTPIFLKDIAEVVDTFKDQESYSRFNGEPNISISLTKRSGTNLLEISEKVKKVTNDYMKKQKIEGLKISFVGDQSIQIKEMVFDLENHVITGFLLVAIVLFIFLGFRNAILVSTAIPLSMFLSFIILQKLGYTLNMIVLFSLVLVLGLLADDAIVVVENIYRYLEKGVKLKKACYQGTKEVAIPVITSTLTTLAAFFPLVFWPGIMGKFMGYMPVTVIVTLTCSLVIALFVNPVIGSRIMGIASAHKQNFQNEGEDNQKQPGRIMQAYERLLRFALKHSKATIGFVFMLLIISIIAYGKLGKGVIFFPDITPTQGYITVKLPGDAVLSETDKVASRIEKFLYKYDDIKNFNANIGGQIGGFNPGQTNPNKAQIAIDFKQRAIDPVGKDFDPRDTLKKIREEVRDVPGAEIDVTRPEGGPPRGAPVSVRISGENFDKLIDYSEQVQKQLKNIKGLINIQDTYEEGLPEITVSLDRGKMALLGVNTALVAGAIRTAIYGTKVSVFRDKDTGDEYDITVRYPQESRQNLEDIENIFVMNFQGKNIPLKVFADIHFSKGIGYIQHKEFDRVIEVTAEVEKGYNSQVLRGDVKKMLAKTLVVPEGYKISFTGEEEEQKKASSFLSNAFLFTIFLIFLVLIAQFHSFLIPIIILGTIVLTFIGLLWGLIITRTPFCIIMTGVGVITLAGIVVKNGILLLDFTVRLREKGMSRIEALVHAGIIRTRPVLLTASTAILGLLPMSTGVSIDFHKFIIVTHSDSSEWWASMSNAVIFGLAVATMLTLVVVPCVYNILDGTKAKLAHKFFGKPLDSEFHR
ncbi:MAG: efflux RND transporter permease subunit [Candidatus Margulisbacteria bacterium]|nr:efflux RND transporter permease subunit [Candidatus Margulisiibacteriota bacterium]